MSGDIPLTISHAWVIPWHGGEGRYGVACEYLDGGSDCSFVGTMYEARVVVEELNRQIADAKPTDNVILLASAASRHRRG